MNMFQPSPDVRQRTAWRSRRAAAVVLALATVAGQPVLAADTALPAPVERALKSAGLSPKSLGVYVAPVDQAHAPPLVAFNAEKPLLMASTAKLVTSMAALDLLGEGHRWPARASSTGEPRDGRLAGDLVLQGSPAGLTTEDLRRWFRQLHDQGLTDVGGRIVLRDFELLQDAPALGLRAGEGGGDGSGDDPEIHVLMQARPSGPPAARLQPAVATVRVIDEVAPTGGCTVYARWKSTSPPVAWLSGGWDRSCGSREAATLPWPAGLSAVAAPPSPASVVAQLWRETGGRLRGGVIERKAASSSPPASTSRWTSAWWTSLPQRLQDINKVSLNAGARRLLQSLADDAGGHDPLARALERVRGWLASRGFAADDLTLELGSGQSHNEKGRPRALAELLRDTWRRGEGAQSLLQSLPVAGVDGTMAHRLANGPAAGRAFLKTGTLNDTRAVAGYVVGRSGRVYAIAALLNHPGAARGVPALDSLVEWIALNG